MTELATKPQAGGLVCSRVALCSLSPLGSPPAGWGLLLCFFCRDPAPSPSVGSPPSRSLTGQGRGGFRDEAQPHTTSLVGSCPACGSH